jgi:hypothetical protein
MRFRVNKFSNSFSTAGEITLKAADSAHIGRQPAPANLLIDLIDQLPVLHHIQKPRERPRIHPDNGITDEVIADPRQLHDDDAQVVDTLRRLHPQQLLTGQMPAHIIDRRRTIVQPVRQRRDLVQRPPLGQLLKSAMDIPHSLLRRDDPFAVQLKDILEHPMRRRMRRPQVQRGGGLLDAAFR